MAEPQQDTTPATICTGKSETEGSPISPTPNDTDKREEPAETLIVPEEVKQPHLEIDSAKTEPDKSTKKARRPLKVKLKIYIRKQFWIDLLLSLSVGFVYYVYQTWPHILSHIPGMHQNEPNNRFPPSNQYLIPSSSFDLLLLAQQELVAYKAIKKCQNEALNPNGTRKYTGGYYLGAVNQYLTDYESSSKLLFEKNFTMGPEYIAGNPIASFRMIDRFVSLLQLLAVNHYPCKEFSSFVQEMFRYIRWPNAKDVEENIIRILRLQHVYNLKTNDVAQGMLANISTGITLSAWQSYQFGLFAQKHRHYYLAVQWLELAIKEVGVSQNESSFYQQLRKSLNKTIFIHDSSWNQTLDLSLQYHFLERLIRQGTPKTKDLTQNYKLSEPSRDFLSRLYRNEYKDFYSYEINYWATCSGEDLRPRSKTQSLYCWHESKNHPTWTIRPLKMELLSLSPDIVQVYDIINDGIIQETINTARPTMEASKVIDKKDPHATHISTSRSSRQAWVKDWSHPQLQYFSKTVERITGLVATNDMASEKLQVLSYSFGGHYDPHVDALKNNITYGRKGDRIMTFMFYLSDVEAGGYTAFTSVGIAARPAKGSGVFWFNLYQDGESDDPISQHGGCPVILGRKHAANKWIRLYAQFQDRKCDRKMRKKMHRAKINGIVPDY